ncbi:MAG TPA: hypothetical protein PLB38_01050 [bacterium]|nr:hypothetical protein [bacterium]
MHEKILDPQQIVEPVSSEKVESVIEKPVDSNLEATAEHGFVLPSRSLRQSVEQIGFTSNQESAGSLSPENQNRLQQLRLMIENPEKTSLTVEEKKEFLKGEVLAELSTEEYISLYKKLNPQYFSHVTRQGFRDHLGLAQHTAGFKEYSQGFKAILENGKMQRSAMSVVDGVVDLKNIDSETVGKLLDTQGITQSDSFSEALQKLHQFLNVHSASAPKFADRTALHFASQMVSDLMYGAERGNEVFMLYPTDFVASQNSLGASRKVNLLESDQEQKWNDVFVWSENGQGISVDSGLVFLPSSTLVDPETGSRYASELKGEGENVKRELIVKEDIKSLLAGFLGDLTAKKNLDSNVLKEEVKARLDQLKTDLRSKGIEVQISSSFVDYLTDDIMQGKSNVETLVNDFIFGSMDSANLDLWMKQPSNAITAREYWEKYFVAHPDVRPKHIIYYDGDPTEAVKRFQEENGIGRNDQSAEAGPMLGFDDNLVKSMGRDQRSNQGNAKIVEGALTVLGEKFKDSLSLNSIRGSIDDFWKDVAGGQSSEELKERARDLLTKLGGVQQQRIEFLLNFKPLAEVAFVNFKNYSVENIKQVLEKINSFFDIRNESDKQWLLAKFIDPILTDFGSNLTHSEVESIFNQAFDFVVGADSNQVETALPANGDVGAEMQKIQEWLNSFNQQIIEEDDDILF